MALGEYRHVPQTLQKGQNVGRHQQHQDSAVPVNTPRQRCTCKHTSQHTKTTLYLSTHQDSVVPVNTPRQRCTCQHSSQHTKIALYLSTRQSTHQNSAVPVNTSRQRGTCQHTKTLLYLLTHQDSLVPVNTQCTSYFMAI